MAYLPKPLVNQTMILAIHIDFLGENQLPGINLPVTVSFPIRNR